MPYQPIAPPSHWPLASTILNQPTHEIERAWEEVLILNMQMMMLVVMMMIMDDDDDDVTMMQVTVFGSGSGATSISTLLASSSSRGLFNRAWLSNPSPKPQRSLAEAELQNKAFYK